MATQILSLVCRNNSDAEFRAWGSAIAAQLAAMGWVQTGDTGQINWTTVLKPALANTEQGFEIWRMNDALQATAPVYMRVGYGSAANVLGAGLWVTVGTGTDGAGVIDPGNLAQFTPKANNGAAAAQNCYFSGAPNRFCLAFGASNSTTAFFFAIERSKDAAGQDTGDSVLCHWTEAGHTAWRQTSYQIGVGSQGVMGLPMGCLMPSVGSGISGSNTSIYPIYFPRGPYLPHGLNVFQYFHADIPALTQITVTIYGATRTLLPLGNAAFNSIPVTGSATLMLWE